MIKTESCDDTFYHISKGKLTPKVAFDFLYEYNWRINKYLLPIQKRNIRIYEKVLAEINPFVDTFTLSENDIKYTKQNEDWYAVCQKWIDIYIDIMRAYRENGYFAKFEIACANLNSISLSLTSEQKSKINCEKVRKLLFELNIKDAKMALSEWPKDVSLPAYEMQKAGLFMELGDVTQAYKILVDELNYVRKGPNKEINHFKITIEAYLVLLARYAKQSVDFMQGKIEENPEVKYNGSFDAYAEIRLFEALLKEQAPKEYEKEEYDLNLEDNISNLISRMKTFSYKPKPVRKTYIPKANGKLRGLGIPSYEAKLVQGAMADVLNEIYENIFWKILNRNDKNM